MYKVRAVRAGKVVQLERKDSAAAYTTARRLASLGWQAEVLPVPACAGCGEELGAISVVNCEGDKPPQRYCIPCAANLPAWEVPEDTARARALLKDLRPALVRRATLRMGVQS
jgi:hypothetical protein